MAPPQPAAIDTLQRVVERRSSWTGLWPTVAVGLGLLCLGSCWSDLGGPGGVSAVCPHGGIEPQGHHLIAPAKCSDGTCLSGRRERKFAYVEFGPLRGGLTASARTMDGSRIVGVADTGPGTCPVPVQSNLEGQPVLQAVAGAGCAQFGSTLANARGTVAYPRGRTFPSTTVAVVEGQQGERDLGMPNGAINAVPVALTASDVLVVQAAFENFNRYEVFVIDLKQAVTQPWKPLPHLTERGSSGAWTINPRGDIYGWSRDGGGNKRAVGWKLFTSPGGEPRYVIEDLNDLPEVPTGWSLASIYASHAAAGIVGEARVDGKPRLFRIDQAGRFTDLGWPQVAGVAAETTFVSAVNADGTAVGDAVIWSPQIVQTGILITADGILPLEDLVELSGLTILGAKGIDDNNRILLRAAVIGTPKERMVVLNPIDPCWLPSLHAGACRGQNSCSGQPEGTPCDDGNACTVADRCVADTCRGNPTTM